MRNAFVFLIALILGCVTIPLDSGVSALSGGEPTVIFEGCNRKLSKGYLFCEAKENSNPALTQIKVFVPVVDCEATHCIEYRVFTPDGNISLSGSIPKGENHFSTSLSELLGKNSPLSESDEGELLLQMRVFFKTKKEQVSEGLFGFIRLKVWDERYFPLPCNSPFHAFTTIITPKCHAQYSSKLRTSLCGECEMEAD